MKIEGEAKGPLDVKRFYIPGVKLVGPCGKCGKELVTDFGDGNYLSYPSVGEIIRIGLCCFDCGWEGEVGATLNISLTLEGS
jgi:hypothetical protein